MAEGERSGWLSATLVEAIYRDGAAYALDDGAPARLARSAEIVRAAAAGSLAVYGVNTGFGKLAQMRIAPADTARLQRNLILSHCCGVGPATPAPVVRLMMALKLASLARGASGVSPALATLLAAMLARGVVPVIPSKGSVGASGDLAPLAHLGAVMIGEGEAMVAGERLPGAAALARVGLLPVALGAKEGLALINGTQFSCAYALAGLIDAADLLRMSLITGAMSTDAAMGSSVPFRAEIHALRGQPGQIDTARALRTLMAGSAIRDSHMENDERVQDPYCLRCQPQVAGAALDLLRQTARTLIVEANAVTDNPIVVAESGEILSGGNFHAEPVAFAADIIALAIAETGAIAQRRIAMLVDPAMNFGLPAFLSPRPGLNSGFMIAEVTSAALMSENRQRATPASVDSTPTSANQEDHVSMAANAARRLAEMNDNLASILAIEWLVAAQGVDLRAPLTTSPHLAAARDTLRAVVPFLEDDRALAGDIAAATAGILARTPLRAVGEAAMARLWPDDGVGADISHEGTRF